VMVCIEEKAQGWTKPKNDHEREQENFLKQMKSRGAIAFFSTSAEAALQTIKKWMF